MALNMNSSWWSLEGACSSTSQEGSSSSPIVGIPQASDKRPTRTDDKKAEFLNQHDVQCISTEGQPTLLQALHASYSSESLNSLSDFFDCTDEPTTNNVQNDESREECATLEFPEPNHKRSASESKQSGSLTARPSSLSEVSLQKHRLDVPLPDALSVTVSRCIKVLSVATSVAVNTALLPVTVPLHLAYSTTDYVLGTTGSILDHFLGRNKNLRTLPALESNSDDDEDSVSESSGEKDRELSPEDSRDLVDESNVSDGPGGTTSLVAHSAASVSSARHTTTAVEQTASDRAVTKKATTSLLGTFWSFPGVVKDITRQVTVDLGSIVFDSIAPSLAENRNLCASDDFLDRLRLDYQPSHRDPISSIYLEPVIPVTPVASFYGPTCEVHPKSTFPISHRPHSLLASGSSDYLLRVDDLSIYRQDLEQESYGTVKRVYYVDLASDAAIELRQHSLSRLVSQGVGLISNTPNLHVPTQLQDRHKSLVDWKPEVGTATLLKSLDAMDSESQIQQLQTSTLIWTGKLIRGGTTVNNSKVPFFLSRGVVPWRPFDFLEMMWDNTRVKLYNKLCTGRTSELVLHDEIVSGGSTGTKVVRFATRVPYTRFSVTMTCVMHVQPLDDCDDGGYIIVSRSMNSGSSGTHFSSHDKVDTSRNQNEILWGVNIIRSVANNPHLTDLTSISQVGSTLVPKVLAGRIGLWGIEDFYKNVRTYEQAD